MNEKRFTIHKESKYKEEWYDYPFCIKEDGEVVLETIPLFIAEKVRDKLNEQDQLIKNLEEENEELKERLEKINGGYGHLTHRNGLTANEWLIESQERELKKKNEQISAWIEQHSKDIAKISKQQATINKLREILAEAEDMIEVRLAEHYIQEYENIKHHIIGDNDE